MKGSMRSKRYQILNTYVDAISMEETIENVEQIISSKTPTQHVVINAAKVNLMEKDLKLRNIVNSCALINADGASILWAAKELGIPLKERVTGIDLFLRLVELADLKGYRIYLLGAKETTVLKVKQIFEEKYKNLKIAGCRNGYFTENEESILVKNLAESGADMLFVAISSPKKEFWINKYMHQLQIPFVMGVGGSFDVVAGVTSRAPIWMQNHGLEWFYRFLQEPGRMWKRYLLGNIKFAVLLYKRKMYMRKLEKNHD